MWYNESIFYQLYPLGFSGAPEINDGIEVNRIRKVIDWISHMKKLGIDTVYFCPVFESDHHGYDTRDYRKIDCRLGSNKDFQEVCRKIHEAGIKIVLDGVFNHVGRGFWAFLDVVKNRESSPYKDWFYIDFNGNSNYNDGLWYDGWEGHFDLVKLNLSCQAVVDHLFECVQKWIDDFHIDGLRLDVAYLLDENFIRKLRTFCKGIREDFLLLGEIIHGDYNRIVNNEMLDSCTNYECFKGIHSSFNTRNMFEIAHSLNRQFGSEDWTIYTDKKLLCFLDNHDVSRIASNLQDPKHLPLAYGLLFGMPGIPCIYYGSEWKAQGVKGDQGDAELRPSFDHPKTNELTGFLSALCKVYKENKVFCYGNYRQVFLTNLQFGFERAFEGERCLVAINIDSEPFDVSFDMPHAEITDLLSNQTLYFNGQLNLPPYSVAFWKFA